MEILLEMQSGPNRSEWPYDCVHKVDWQTPIGYRVGGTAIAALALMHAADDVEEGSNEARSQAIKRAAAFIIEAAHHPNMDPSTAATYDVRGWGYTYGLLFLLREAQTGILPDQLHSQRDEAIDLFVRSLIATELPEHGGWNYDHRGLALRPVPPSPFMTAATLQVLFDAQALGYAVPEEAIERGLDSIERARRPTGAYVYSGFATGRSTEAVPGSVGRMVIAETTLHLGGRASADGVRAAIDSFMDHWDWLDRRRGAVGTHAPPYGIAPYYFMFAHYYAAQAVELLPEEERPGYRRRLNERLLSVRRADGSWNDRTFERSAAYGTAMSMMALTMPDLPRPSTWSPDTSR